MQCNLKPMVLFLPRVHSQHEPRNVLPWGKEGKKKKKTIGGSTTSGLQPWQGNLLHHPSLPCICVYLHVDSWSLPPREYRLQKRSLAVPCCQLPNRWVSLNAPPTLVVAKHLAGSTLAPILPVDTQRQHASATRY